MVEIAENGGASTLRSVESEIIGIEEERLMIR
jgi:hypothetical protein